MLDEIFNNQVAYLQELRRDTPRLIIIQDGFVNLQKCLAELNEKTYLRQKELNVVQM